MATKKNDFSPVHPSTVLSALQKIIFTPAKNQDAWEIELVKNDLFRDTVFSLSTDAACKLHGTASNDSYLAFTKW